MSDYIIGKNTINEVLKNRKDILIKIITSLNPNNEFLEEIKKLKIPIEFQSKKALENLVNTESHQNIIAKIKSRNYLELNDLFFKTKDKKKSIVVMVDSIYDPQNLGSILRACECFNIDALVYSKNRGTDITPVTTKAASGATELLDIVKISNLASTIERFKKEGYWVVSAALDEKSKDINTFEKFEKLLLVLGSEGEGIQPILLKNSDFLMHIKMMGKIDSLNVSQATAVALFYFSY
ncbi:MAG: 23S rRNA (guanosine(2251)-2'-O)-methyltransferase RlmB [Chlamydiae bacterium RIFCSPHIGHO2_12_FULL_27_8]|nr:MAG: 23S rRNA (guanosine(2251)-2'-O)-methyltransferase RlmB [Chlamydiae bacterium RIFCSPHIGHO2_12_FULL_27_8]